MRDLASSWQEICSLCLKVAIEGYFSFESVYDLPGVQPRMGSSAQPSLAWFCFNFPCNVGSHEHFSAPEIVSLRACILPLPYACVHMCKKWTGQRERRRRVVEEGGMELGGFLCFHSLHQIRVTKERGHYPLTHSNLIRFLART